MKLEIGPGPEKLGPDWTTVSAAPSPSVDLLCEWGMDPLPFEDGTVDEVYACHVIEHVPWLLTEAALVEVWRILKVGGLIELHTICFETLARDYHHGDLEPGRQGHPMRNLSYRLFSYSHRVGDRACLQWHHALFDSRYLTELLRGAGFKDCGSVKEPRGPEKHGRYNLGVKAVKA